MGTAGAAAPSPSAGTTVNYTDHSVNISYASAEPASAAAVPDIQPAAVPIAEAVSVAPKAPAASTQGAGIAAAAVAGAGVGAGAVAGAMHLKKQRDAQAAKEKPPAGSDYDPEIELEKAIRRVHELEDA